jgi:hypothetical protein
MGHVRNSYKTGKPEEKRFLSEMWALDGKTTLKWMLDVWQAVVNMLMNFQVP